MTWLDETLDRLADRSYWSYQLNGPAAAEPVALSALALLAHGRTEQAKPAIDWLVRSQSAEGWVAVAGQHDSPHWPTSLAMLAWRACDEHNSRARYAGVIDRAAQWLLEAHGTTPRQLEHVGHDTTIPGWPWVLSTHSWLEPTAWAVIALKACGFENHQRTRDGVRLLIDRQLPSGGCNYGNTLVLGQPTLPHLQPTGLAALALAGESDPSSRLDRTLALLESQIRRTTGAASLAHALLGLAAHDRLPADYASLLARRMSTKRVLGRTSAGLSLAALAAAGYEASATLGLRTAIP